MTIISVMIITMTFTYYLILVPEVPAMFQTLL